MTSPRSNSRRRLVFSIARLEMGRLAVVFAATPHPVGGPFQELLGADTRCAEKTVRFLGVSDEAHAEFRARENWAPAEPLPDGLRRFTHAEDLRPREIENEGRRVDVL